MRIKSNCSWKSFHVTFLSENSFVFAWGFAVMLPSSLIHEFLIVSLVIHDQIAPELIFFAKLCEVFFSFSFQLPFVIRLHIVFIDVRKIKIWKMSEDSVHVDQWTHFFLSEGSVKKHHRITAIDTSIQFMKSRKTIKSFTWRARGSGGSMDTKCKVSLPPTLPLANGKPLASLMAARGLAAHRIKRSKRRVIGFGGPYWYLTAPPRPPTPLQETFSNIIAYIITA